MYRYRIVSEVSPGSESRFFRPEYRIGSNIQPNNKFAKITHSLQERMQIAALKLKHNMDMHRPSQTALIQCRAGHSRFKKTYKCFEASKLLIPALPLLTPF